MQTPEKKIKLELSEEETKWVDFLGRLDWFLYEPVCSIMVDRYDPNKSTSIHAYNMKQFNPLYISFINLPINRSDEEYANVVQVNTEFKTPVELLQYISNYYLETFMEEGEEDENKRLKVLGLFSDRYSEREKMGFIIERLSGLITGHGNKEKRRCPIMDCIGLVRFEGVDIVDSTWSLKLGS